MNELTTRDDNLITLSNNVINEQQLTEFFSVLESFSAIVSKECLDTVMPFLCQYVYPSCDGNGSAQFITQKQCINIRDDLCEIEWRIAMTTEHGNLLPVCETFGNDNESSSINNELNMEPLNVTISLRSFVVYACHCVVLFHNILIKSSYVKELSSY